MLNHAIVQFEPRMLILQFNYLLQKRKIFGNKYI